MRRSSSLCSLLLVVGLTLLLIPERAEADPGFIQLVRQVRNAIQSRNARAGGFAAREAQKQFRQQLRTVMRELNTKTKSLLLKGRLALYDFRDNRLVKLESAIKTQLQRLQSIRLRRLSAGYATQQGLMDRNRQLQEGRFLGHFYGRQQPAWVRPLRYRTVYAVAGHHFGGPPAP
ncbi:MAG: hypothetical protein H6707_15385 [Deltaproteobacteria bacterium]|nr:hypothetical protein [Deltaproteobacteria bacterium]